MLRYQNKNCLEVGVDECARGCLFGRIYGCAVIYPSEGIDKNIEILIKDSKKLSRKKRKLIYDYLIQNIKYAIHYCDNTEIDTIGIQKCNYKVFHESIKKLNVIPDKILVDGKCFDPISINNKQINHECIIKGDNIYLSIACASIIAKVEHDKYIELLINEKPFLKNYHLQTNYGYGTKDHIYAISKFGLSEFHRKSYNIKKLKK
jgi:ribonuclease HII